jgi:hypothetical protein
MRGTLLSATRRWVTCATARSNAGVRARGSFEPRAARSARRDPRKKSEIASLGPLTNPTTHDIVRPRLSSLPNQACAALLAQTRSNAASTSSSGAFSFQVRTRLRRRRPSHASARGCARESSSRDEKEILVTARKKVVCHSPPRSRVPPSPRRLSRAMRCPSKAWPTASGTGSAPRWTPSRNRSRGCALPPSAHPSRG